MAKKLRVKKQQEPVVPVVPTLIGGAGKHSHRRVVLVVVAVLALSGLGYITYHYYGQQQQATSNKAALERAAQMNKQYTQTRISQLESQKPKPTDPGYVLAAYYTEYADLLNQAGQPDQALAKLQEAEAIPSTHNSSYLFELLARQYQKKGDSTRAKAYWQKALDAVDSDPSVADEIKNDVKQNYRNELK